MISGRVCDQKDHIEQPNGSLSKRKGDVMADSNTGAIQDVDFYEAYSLYWRRWNDYQGRSSRQEYWKWFLVNLVIILVLLLGGGLLRINPAPIMLMDVICIAPSVSLLSRRLHDAGHTGRWAIPVVAVFAVIFITTFYTLTGGLFIGQGGVLFAKLLVAIQYAGLIGEAIALILACKKSAPDNQYGSRPSQSPMSRPRSTFFRSWF
jgi:uncharacterized membrane protein YhaH (DUF805 family)